MTDLAYLKGLIEKASSLPWAKGGPFDDLCSAAGDPVQISGNMGIGLGSVVGRPDRQANSELLLAAVNSLPDLIEEVERLREALKPFARVGENFTVKGGWSGSDEIELEMREGFNVLDRLPVAAFWAARAALGESVA